MSNARWTLKTNEFRVNKNYVARLTIKIGMAKRRSQTRSLPLPVLTVSNDEACLLQQTS